MKAAIIGLFFMVSVVSVQAWYFTGMGNLSDFIKDIVALVPDLITLAVYGAVLAVVGLMVGWLKGFFKNGGFSK